MNFVALQVSKKNYGVSTQTQRYLKEDKDKLGSKSAPKDLGMGRKRKKPLYGEMRNITPLKPKTRGGWITEDPGDSPQRKAKVKSWRSPATPTNKSHKRPTSTFGHYSSSQSSRKTQKFYSGNSTWHGPDKRPTSTFGHYSSSQSSIKTQKFYYGNSTWHGPANASYSNSYSASRFGSSSGDVVRRHYDDWW